MLLLRQNAEHAPRFVMSFCSCFLGFAINPNAKEACQGWRCEAYMDVFTACPEKLLRSLDTTQCKHTQITKEKLNNNPKSLPTIKLKA